MQDLVVQVLKAGQTDLVGTHGIGSRHCQEFTLWCLSFEVESDFEPGFGGRLQHGKLFFSAKADIGIFGSDLKIGPYSADVLQQPLIQRAKMFFSLVLLLDQ